MAKQNGEKGVLEKKLKGPVEYVQGLSEAGKVRIEGRVRYPTGGQFMKVEDARVGQLQTGYFVTFRADGIGVKLYVGPKPRVSESHQPMKDLYNALTAYATRCNS